MCGIVGLLAKSHLAPRLYDALTVLQHRGQDAAGIVTTDDEHLYLRKGNGLVRDVFHPEHMARLQGNLGLGHVRYPTAGTFSQVEAQPFYVNSPYGIALAHNGTLTNAEPLKKSLYKTDLRHINTNSDSEVLLNVLAHELLALKATDLSHTHIFEAMQVVYRRCKGAFAAVAMIMNFGLIAFRDPYGIRPLVYGKRESEHGTEYMVASESVALDVLGFEFVADVAPGEVVVFRDNGHIIKKHCAPKVPQSPCIFEYVYLARPDSILDNISVYKTRLRLGETLAGQILSQWPLHDIDVVIPVPDTSRTAALPLAHRLGVKYREGFIKNRYIGRTFIMPGQSIRKKSVRQKLNVISLEFKDKNVLLVDDSIVRGTTSQQIVQMAYEAGAKKVYFASTAPPIKYPNVYGIDMPTATDLVAYNRSESEIAQHIGVDRIFFQSLENLIKAAQSGNPNIKNFETAIFTGHYITGDIDENFLTNLAQKRQRAEQDKKNEATRRTLIEI